MVPWTEGSFRASFCTMRLINTLMAASLIATQATATEDCSADAMIVFDGSGSMAEMGFNDFDEPRINEARRAVAQVVPQIAQMRDLGLIIYGPGGDDLCAGLDLRFAPMPGAAPRVISDIEALEPAGDTALTRAVERAAEVLDHRAAPGTILLVTDGKETCGGAPCALAAQLAAQAADLTVHVIGYKVRGQFFSWQSEGDQQSETVARCLADQTGGLYVSAETVDDLIAAFRKTLGCNVLF